ncbi:unnamed protein product [Natator depressus]
MLQVGHAVSPWRFFPSLVGMRLSFCPAVPLAPLMPGFVLQCSRNGTYLLAHLDLLKAQIVNDKCCKRQDSVLSRDWPAMKARVRSSSECEDIWICSGAAVYFNDLHRIMGNKHLVGAAMKYSVNTCLDLTHYSLHMRTANQALDPG